MVNSIIKNPHADLKNIKHFENANSSFFFIQKVGSGPGKKRDNPNVKQEITESLIKLPKVASTTSCTHSIHFKPTGHGGKMVKKLYIHNNQIILDSTKLFQAAGAKSGQLITTTATLNSDKTQTTNHMTSPTTSEQMIKQEPQDLPLRYFFLKMLFFKVENIKSRFRP